MNCYTKDDRVYIDIDESTHLEFEKDGLLEKIRGIPTNYMSSEERNELIDYIKKNIT